jgi:hypothetical protein
MFICIAKKWRVVVEDFVEEKKWNKKHIFGFILCTILLLIDSIYCGAEKNTQ